MPDQVLQGGFVRLIDGVLAVDAGIAPGAVVVDQQGLQAQAFVDNAVQLQQVVAFQRLVEALHQQLRAIAVDGQAGRAFLAAMEQAIAVGALLVQLAEQLQALVEGGAQRLIQGRHAGRALEK